MAPITSPPQVQKPANDWKPQAQSEEQIAAGLREAFRQAIEEGIIDRESDANSEF